MPISFVNTNKDPNRFINAHSTRIAAEATKEQVPDIVGKLEASKLENLRLTSEIASLTKMVDNLRAELSRLTDDNALLRGIPEEVNGTGYETFGPSYRSGT